MNTCILSSNWSSSCTLLSPCLCCCDFEKLRLPLKTLSGSGAEGIFFPQEEQFACLPPQHWRRRVPRKAQLLLAKQKGSVFSGAVLTQHQCSHHPGIKNSSPQIENISNTVCLFMHSIYFYVYSETWYYTCVCCLWSLQWSVYLLQSKSLFSSLLCGQLSLPIAHCFQGISADWQGHAVLTNKNYTLDIHVQANMFWIYSKTFSRIW